MTELSFHELFPPRGLGVESMTALIRPLASRPRVGLRQRMPLVVFEQWAAHGQVRYLLGVQAPLDDAFVAQLVAAIPGLVARPLDDDTIRAGISYGAEVTMTSFSATLRTDIAPEVSAAVGSALAAAAHSDTLVVQWVVGPAQQRSVRPLPYRPLVQLGFVAPQPTSASELSAWRQKASEPLFAIRGRLGTTGPLGSLRDLRTAVQLADSAHGHLIVGPPSRRAASRLLTVPRTRWGGIVSAKELATLLAWPLDGGDHARQRPIGDLPPAPSARGRGLGTSLHPAATGQSVTLPESSLSRHVHIQAPTGTGKSNLLGSMALNDIAAGRATIVFDPKGDLNDAIMARLDDAVLDRVVVLDAGEVRRSVGSNPLAGEPLTAERRADEIVGLFRFLHGTALGPRSADVLLHALLLVARSAGGTLVDVPVVLTNPAFRQRLAATLDDPLVLGPWLAWFDGLSEGERTQVVAPILNKLRGFTTRASLRRLLGQSDPGWDWDSVLAEQGIVLVSLNRGVLGPEATRLLGALLLGQLWGAIQRRTRLPAAQRPLAAVIVDEWQLFAGSLDFADVLETARGMGVSITAANQAFTQLPPDLRAAVAANTRSKVAFLPARDDAKGMAALLSTPSVTDEDLLRLRPFEAVATMYGQPGAFHVATEEIVPALCSPDSVRQASQQRFGRDGEEIDAALLQRWQSPPRGGIGRIARGDPS